MEFLRFGSSIPGSYWGCCAVDIIQNFKVDPDTKASIALVNGDAGQPLFKNSQPAFIGLTYKEIFLQRLRIGTFDTRDMPNHAFIAILSEQQLKGAYGKAWLAILKEQGFEFIRTVSNSVYTGNRTGPSGDAAMNHIFALFRNIGKGNTTNPFTPPKAWTDLPAVVTEACEAIPETEALADTQREQQLKLWEALPPLNLLTEAEVEAAGVPVTYAGKRSQFPQEAKDVRKMKEGTAAKAPKKAAPGVFGCAPASTEVKAA